MAAPSLACEFHELAQRFRAVDASTPADGMKYVRRLEASGARLLKRGHDARLLLRDWDIEWLTDVDKDIESGVWAAQWCAIGDGLRMMASERFPADLGLRRFDEGSRGKVGTGPRPEDWHALAQEDAWLCDYWAGELERLPAGKTKTAKRRGRQPDTDAREDKRIYDAWQQGKYPTYFGLARELGIDYSAKKVADAIDRQRKRELRRKSR